MSGRRKWGWERRKGRNGKKGEREVKRRGRRHREKTDRKRGVK